ncbi:hypothetical protein, partial [Rhodococcus zopfii]|uniref:hypothetical protein n=1 Tax=Rhodococcus zopfii TaxID=43772 RepID=UPI001EDE1BB4
MGERCATAASDGAPAAAARVLLPWWGGRRDLHERGRSRRLGGRAHLAQLGAEFVGALAGGIG